MPNTELIEYFIFIPTIDGNTFCATATEVSEYSTKSTKSLEILEEVLVFILDSVPRI